MSNNAIKVNDVTFNAAAGRPMTFQGKHSGKILSGIDLDFSAWGQENIERVERLFTHDTVQVDDPFADRFYEASLRKVSYSYQEGRPERHYVAEIRELDMPPEFEVLEIEGHQFPVLRYIETDHENDAIGRHALLRLSKERFVELQSLFKPGSVQIRRIGVDEEPISARYGGAMYWSRHEEGEETCYKQIIRFFPPDLPSPRIHLASGAQQDALARMMLALSARFEALVDELTQSGVINDERRAALFGENWEELLDSDRMNEIRWQLDRVHDAEEEFG